jgi:DNA-binding transcriptional LysR family regulator
MLNPKALDAFRTVIVTGSTTAAAESMHVSQPAVSRLLKSLEAALGYRLFVRVRGRLAPTPEGLALFEEVRRYFTGLDHLESVARQIKGKPGRLYRVAAMPPLGLRVLPAIFGKLGRSPTVPVLEMSVSRSSSVAQLVLSGRCDLGLLSQAIDEPGMQVVAHHAVDCLCILPRGHPLTARAAVMWSEFADYPIVSLNGSTITGVRTAAALKAIRRRPMIRVETHNCSVASCAVLSGCGIAITDAFTARDHVERGGEARPLVAPIQFEFKAVKPATFANPPIQRRMLEALAAEVESVTRWSRSRHAEAVPAAAPRASA